MSKTQAQFFSVVFHPVFINIYCLGVLFYVYPELSFALPQRLKWFFMGFLFVATSVVPLILVLILKFGGTVKTITLESAKERTLPYLLTLAMQVYCYVNFANNPGTPLLILQYLEAGICVMLLLLIANFFTKVSLHLAILGTLCALIAAAGKTGIDVRFMLIPALVLSGWIASARLFAEAHKPYQIYLGFVLGFLPMYLLISQNITPLILNI